MSVHHPPQLSGLLESSLYVEDLERSSHFYETLLGLERVAGDDDRFRALAVTPAQLLLLFRKGSANRPLTTPGGEIPPHDGDGRLHLAFACPATDLSRWEAHLTAEGVPIVSRVEWPRGGTSLYFHDPDGHVLELATPGLWPSY
jgi:catechol 2,3-dioxygenase-like lactoylglutathione lyase family enzyme